MGKVAASLKYLKPHDFYDPFIFIFALFISRPLWFVNKIRGRKVWLIMEDGEHARDNGYYFYKYVREQHKSDPCYFVINKKSHDYQKVAKFGTANIINYRSLKHWLYYLTAHYNISNQKSGNPSPALFYVLHVSLGVFNNRVFLQHGITHNEATWLLYKNTRFRYFICGAKPEYNYILKNFGYPKANIVLTGFPRFDNLHDFAVNKKQILVMPTWRNWLGRDTNALAGTKTDFKTTPYFKNWNALLSDPALIDFIEKHHIELLFYPHIVMQPYLSAFNSESKNVKFLDPGTDIQSMLKSSALLITDYSSVFMDFAYMGKPLVHFLFDEKDYRKKQHGEGYFRLKDNSFGDLVYDIPTLIKKLQFYYNNNYKLENIYTKRAKDFFVPKDQANCARVYQVLRGNSA